MEQEKSLLELDEQRSRSSHIADQRMSLASRVGSGQITPQSSWENAIKVGRVRGKVAQSAEKHQEKVNAIDHQMQLRAGEYQNLISLRETQLQQMQELVNRGLLDSEEIEPWEEEFTRLSTLPQNNPGLQRGLEELSATDDKSTISDTPVQGIERPRSPEVECESPEQTTLIGLPSIPELNWIESYNVHKYNPDVTVAAKKEIAQLTPDDQRTPEQKQMLEDIEVLQSFGVSSRYQNVYTPEEIHNLAVNLQQLKQKNRPDFNGVEDRLVDFLHGEIDRFRDDPIQEEYVKSLRGIIRRADRNNPTRRGMTWDKLNAAARIASKALRARTEESYSTQGEYFIYLNEETTSEQPNLTPVFQFMADMHASETIAARSNYVRKARMEAFVSNCDIINNWYSQHEALINALPDSLKINARTGRGLATTPIQARYRIVSLIDTMNIRLSGKEMSGQNKKYTMDPGGAISLQKVINYAVEEINKQLTSPSPEEEEIVPLS